jgi:hypothetical protein
VRAVTLLRGVTLRSVSSPSVHVRGVTEEKHDYRVETGTGSRIDRRGSPIKVGEENRLSMMLSAGFKPYTAIPLKKSALVRVVIGPNVESADLAVSTERRLLDRYGFRHTEVALSEHSYRT